jgi:RHS repeat-associated protein
MTAMPHLSDMNWDFEDQLQMVDLGGGGKAYYVYDAAGQRTRKIWEKSPALIEESIYLGGFEVFRRRNGGGTVTLERETLHVMDDKQRIALVETRTHGNDGSPPQLIRYQSSNHLDSASLELDDVGEIISYEEYYPYGSTSYQAVRSQTETAKRYRYTGKQRDEETGLAYHGARYYAPWLGRWTRSDPATIADGLNTYAYVANNPIGLLDPTGHQGIKFKSMEAAAEYEKQRHSEDTLKPNQIADVYEEPKDVPKALEPSPPSPQAATKQRSRIRVGAAKQAVAKEEAAKNPPLTQDERFEIAKGSARNWLFDQLAEPLKGALQSYRADEPPERPHNFREYQKREAYDFMQGTANTILVALSFVPWGELAAAGRVAAGKLPMPEGTGMAGGGKVITFSERWAAEAGAATTPANAGVSAETATQQLVRSEARDRLEIILRTELEWGFGGREAAESVATTRSRAEVEGLLDDVRGRIRILETKGDVDRDLEEMAKLYELEMVLYDAWKMMLP